MPMTIAPDLQRRAAAVGLLGLLAGCGELLPKAPPLPALFALDATDAATGPRAPRAGGRTLIVSPLTAAPGFDTARIVYVKEAHRLDHYAQSEWVDTPARMLAPQVVAAIAGTGTFAAVLLAPSGVAGDLRLDIALLCLQHDFTTPRSQVRLTLRATLWDSATRRVRQQRMFDERVDATRDDAYGGVLAANRAAAQALRGVAAMCVEEGGG